MSFRFADADFKNDDLKIVGRLNYECEKDLFENIQDIPVEGENGILTFTPVQKYAEDKYNWDLAVKTAEENHKMALEVKSALKKKHAEERYRQDIEAKRAEEEYQKALAVHIILKAIPKLATNV